MTDSLIEVQHPAERIVRIVLNRPAVRNAQDTHLLYQLNDAFDAAAQDDDVSVIVLAANGPHFSSGHDMREPNKIENMVQYRTVGNWCGFGCDGAESQMAREKELYLGLCERWRALPKPTIAEVHGKVIAGGLMLIWPCDIIIAAESACFADNTVAMGVSGAEFFNHPWELGIRKAKEILFTSRFFTATEALEAGMVNHVVPDSALADFTLDMASLIARQPLFALKLAKEALNAAQDAQGRVSAQHTAFALHQLCHSHNSQLYGQIVDPGFAKGKWQASTLATTSTSAEHKLLRDE